MTRDVKLATAAAVALLVAFAIMALFHSYGPHPSLMHPDFQGAPPVTGMWSDIGWLMALGPIAMILFFGSGLTLAVLLIRYGAKVD